MVHRAPLWRRLLALLYDWMLVASLLFTITIVGVLVFDLQANVWYFYGVLVPVTYAYFALSWARGGQTLGMCAWRVLLLSDSGGKVTQVQIFCRFIGAGISTLCLGFGFFIQVFNAKKLTFHDYCSRTFLVETVKVKGV